MVNLLVLLLVFMIIAAIIAIWTDNLLSAVIAVGAVGFGSSVAFLLLSAPDLALTQIVVEVLTLVILIRATIGREVRTVAGGRETLGMAFAGALVLLLLVFAVGVMSVLPEFGVPAISRVGDAPAALYLERGLGETGSANIVTAVLLDFRAYDTLGEATVLFTAIVGAMALLRRKSRPEELQGGIQA
jgi:multisubunit Na+/H+ antiporter MnhB subunit